jgi:hypothetical protein
MPEIKYKGSTSTSKAGESKFDLNCVGVSLNQTILIVNMRAFRLDD